MQNFNCNEGTVLIDPQGSYVCVIHYKSLRIHSYLPFSSLVFSFNVKNNNVALSCKLLLFDYWI